MKKIIFITAVYLFAILSLTPSVFARTTIQIEKNGKLVTLQGIGFERCEDGTVVVVELKATKNYPRYELNPSGDCKTAGTFRTFLNTSTRMKLSANDTEHNFVLKMDTVTITTSDETLTNELTEAMSVFYLKKENTEAQKPATVALYFVEAISMNDQDWIYLETGFRNLSSGSLESRKFADK